MNYLQKIKQKYQKGGIHSVARSIVRFIRSRTILQTKIRLRTAILSFFHQGIADPYKVIWIDPDKITHINGLFGRQDVGRIVGGTWDNQTTSFAGTTKYELVRRYLTMTADWNEILDDLVYPKLEADGSWDGMTTKSEILTRYERIGDTCKSIAKEGYKSYKELGESRTALNHVAVNISRSGNFIFAGSGFHRLSAAKVLEVETIPVQVWVRHTKWQQVRDSIVETGEIPQGVSDHPDIRDLKVLS